MLLDATVTAWAPERLRVSAAAALVGLRFPATAAAAICEIDVQVTRLDVISASAPLSREMRFPRGDGMVLYGVAPGTSAKTSWEDSRANLTLSYASKSAPADLYRHYHVFSPVLKIELDEPVPFIDFSDCWLDPLRDLTSTSTGGAESVTWATALGEDEHHGDGTWQVFAAGITQKPYASSEAEIVSAQSALALQRDADDLLSLLRRWKELDDALHPVIHTFGREVRALTGQKPRGRFLTLMQAIEGAHQREEALLMATKQAGHTQQRDAVLAKSVEQGWTGKERRFLKNYLAKDRHSASETALRWFAGEVPGDIGARVARTALINSMLTSGDASTWADALRIVRNNLSHGRASYRPQELEALNEVLSPHLISLTLKLIGASMSAQQRASQLR